MSLICFLAEAQRTQRLTCLDYTEPKSGFLQRIMMILAIASPTSNVLLSLCFCGKILIVSTKTDENPNHIVFLSFFASSAPLREK